MTAMFRQFFFQQETEGAAPVAPVTYPAVFSAGIQTVPGSGIIQGDPGTGVFSMYQPWVPGSPSTTSARALSGDRTPPEYELPRVSGDLEGWKKGDPQKTSWRRTPARKTSREILESDISIRETNRDDEN